MNCPNCGNEIIEGDHFCRKCGKEIETTEQLEPAEQPKPTEQLEPTNQPVKKKNSNSALKIILIVIGSIFAFIIAIIVFCVLVFTYVSNNSSKMICKSDQGTITIMYNKDELVGYTAVGFTYDFNGQKKIADDIGVDAYLKEFNTWYKENTNGKCTINNEDVDSDITIKNDTKEVGSEKYGYINVPNDWLKFQDVDGNDSIQYSYANIFIVSMNMLEDNTHTTKEYAENYMYNKEQSGEVEDVNGATLTIGDNDQYTAYQVYMYYPEDKTFLVTYWFEAEDGKTHYLAIEGPEEYNSTKLSDLLYIPESFHLKK